MSTGRLRAVVVGTGAMGRGWLRTVCDHEEVELAGVADLDVDQAHAAVAETAAPPDVVVGGTAEEVMDEVEPDVVVDVAIPEAHHAITLAALSRGIPVLGEKPLAATMTEAVELVAASRAYDRLFMVSQNRRYHPQLFALRDRLGALGRLGVLVAEFFKAPRFGGFRETMDNPLVLDMAIHTFDAARFLTGAEPVAVSCAEYNPPWSWYAGNAAATATFEMSDGARYVYTGSWCSPGFETSWNGSWRISGEHGTARWDGEGEPTLELVAGEEASTANEAGEAVGAVRSGGVDEPHGTPASPGTTALPGTGIDGSLRDFVSALRTGTRPMGACADNLWSLGMVHAALESARTGRRVEVASVIDEARAEARKRATGVVREALE